MSSNMNFAPKQSDVMALTSHSVIHSVNDIVVVVPPFTQPTLLTLTDNEPFNCAHVLLLYVPHPPGGRTIRNYEKFHPGFRPWQSYDDCVAATVAFHSKLVPKWNAHIYCAKCVYFCNYNCLSKGRIAQLSRGAIIYLCCARV